MNACKICNREFASIRGLFRHINKGIHQLKSKQYYDMYLKNKPNSCIVCGKETKYISLSKGYMLYCSRNCLFKSEIRSQKISETKKGVIFSEEHCQNIAKSKKGKPSAFRGKHHTKESKKKLSDSQLGSVPWNKGRIGVYSEETLRKMRENHVSHDQFGCKNYMYGKKQTIESNNERSRSLMGRKMSKESINKTRMALLGKKSSEKTRRLISVNHADVGKDRNPNWRGGTSFLPYCHKFNDRLKDKIRERDNRTCQLCSTPENGHKHSVHHIHYDKENCYPDLITLCKSCNAKVNFNRNYHESLFMNKLNEKDLLFWIQYNNKDGVNNG